LRIVTKYIARNVISSMLIVLLVLVGVQSFVQLAAQLQDVGKGDYSWLHAIAFVPLMLPSDVYQLVPMAALLGSLLGLGRLASHNELVVLRTSGMSKWQLVLAVWRVALVALLLVTLIGEGLAPYTRNFALRMKTTALTQGQTLQTAAGTWVRDGQNFIHINKINAKNEVTGVTRYVFNQQHQLLLASFAKRGIFQHHNWTFYDVKQSRLTPEKVITEHLRIQHWPLRLDPQHLQLSEVDPHQQTLWQLFDYLHFRRRSGFGIGEFAYVFWQRLMQPLTTLVMILLAVPVIFGPLRNGNMGVRIVSGVLLGFGFYILNKFLAPFSIVFQLPPMLAALVPALIFAMMGALLLRVVR